MLMETIRNREGQAIAFMTQMSSQIVLTNTDGRKLGYYDQNTNATYDANCWKMGTGNLLGMLIR